MTSENTCKCLINQRNPWSRVLRKPLLLQLVKKLQTFVEFKVHFHVENGPSLASMLSQINPVHTFQTVSL